MYKIIATCTFASSILVTQMVWKSESELRYDYANVIDREVSCVSDSGCVGDDHIYRTTTGAVCNSRVEECNRR